MILRDGEATDIVNIYIYAKGDKGSASPKKRKCIKIQKIL